MSGPLIALTGVFYFWVAIEQVVKGNAPMAVTFGAYALANVGLFMGVK